MQASHFIIDQLPNEKYCPHPIPAHSKKLQMFSNSAHSKNIDSKIDNRNVVYNNHWFGSVYVRTSAFFLR